MKRFVFLTSLVLLIGCKYIESSTGTDDPYGPISGSGRLEENECLVNARILRQLDSVNYQLRIFQIKQRSRTFFQPLKPGDKIDLYTPIELEVGSDRDIRIQWIKTESGGYYMQSSSAE